MQRYPGASLCISSSLRYSFSGVVQRTATSIALLSVLVAGILAPSELCLLMCERLPRAETQRHCIQSSDTMSGMAHHHSAMNHPAVQSTSLVTVSPSCQLNCVTAECFNVSRGVFSQVTLVESGPLLLDTTAEFAPPDHGAAWSSDNSPPYSPFAQIASFSILRI